MGLEINTLQKRPVRIWSFLWLNKTKSLVLFVGFSYNQHKFISEDTNFQTNNDVIHT